MPNRFDIKEFMYREFDDLLKKELEEKVKQFLFDEGCYGSTAVANVIVELMWVVLGNKVKK